MAGSLCARVPAFRSGAGLRSTCASVLSPGLSLGLGLGLLLAPASAAPRARPAWVEGDSPAALLAALQEKYGTREKKYAALVKKVAREVQRALDQTEWRPASETAPARTFREHPWLVRVERLAGAARRKPDVREQTRTLLARYPWPERLELAAGLDYGSDRPVPEHENGFIALGHAPERGGDPLPSFVNTYLFGLQEIVGWDYGVEVSKKTLRHRPRKPREAVEWESELPPWEALRVYLAGSLPEVPLLALPQLQHELHSRLAQRREEGGTPTEMDELLAFLDSRWNGFTYEVPYTEERLAIALPVFALMTDRSQLVYASAVGERLAQAGDIPFVSVSTLQAYAQQFRGEQVGPGDFIAHNEAGRAASDAFFGACNHLVRYRALLDLFAYALLAPDLPLPGYLRYLDYSGGAIPRTRENDRALDVPRAHALLVWALAGGDPERLAGWLHENLLGLEANAFPKDVALPVAFTLRVRERERALLEELHAALASGGELEREFAPWADATEPSDDLATPYLVHSFQQGNADVARLIRETARAVVEKEL